MTTYAEILNINEPKTGKTNKILVFSGEKSAELQEKWVDYWGYYYLKGKDSPNANRLKSNAIKDFLAENEFTPASEVFFYKETK